MRLINTSATGTGTSHLIDSSTNNRTFQATVAGTGAVSATVAIEVSNNNTYWVTLATFSLSGTTSNTDGFTSSAPWMYVRANCTAISGTGAVVTVDMGV